MNSSCKLSYGEPLSANGPHAYVRISDLINTSVAGSDLQKNYHPVSASIARRACVLVIGRLAAFSGLPFRNKS